MKEIFFLKEEYIINSLKFIIQYRFWLLYNNKFILYKADIKEVSNYSYVKNYKFLKKTLNNFYMYIWRK